MLTAENLTELRNQPGTPNRLAKAMELAGMTQAEVASGVGVGQPHVSDICKGNVKKLPLELAQRIASLFGPACTVDDVFPPSAAALSSDAIHESQDAPSTVALSSVNDSENPVKAS